MLLLPVVYYANCVLTASYVSYQTQFMAGTIPIYVAFHVFVMHRFGRLGWFVALQCYLINIYACHHF